jgi:NTE family protein
VMASCAIPGVYSPVRAGGHTLIDGGAHSTTNLDLAARDHAGLIVGVAPMAYDSTERPAALAQIARRRAAVSLRRELHRARRAGAEVLLVRPSAGECDLHGMRFMNPDSVEAVARAAYESTCRLLETSRFRRALAA